MIGFWLVNLIVPEEPQTLKINAPSGTWTLNKGSSYTKCLQGIRDNQCANTYTIDNPVSIRDGAAAVDRALEEMTPLLLGASFLTGLCVTAKLGTLGSDIPGIIRSDHWPRERAIGEGQPIVNNQADFVKFIEAFLLGWPNVSQTEKMLLLVHHWLDALACWSFEDLYLSATTLLQIIAATEKDIQGKTWQQLPYFDAIRDASARVGITPLSADFKNMRNNLIHEGKLIGNHFAGPTLDECAVVAADVLNWFDNYIFSILRLGVVSQKRFSPPDFFCLNAFSVDIE